MVLLREIKKTFIERSWKSILLPKRSKRVEALKGVSLKVEKGEVFGLLGPNGAGKTTLLKILATLIMPDSGEARLFGIDLLKHPGEIRKLIGLVNTNERSFYWRLTGRQNLQFFASLYNIGYRAKKNLVDEMLDFIGISEIGNTPFMKYSSGEKQRLSVARALLPDPEILLMDEPTNSLDPMAAIKIRKFVKDRLASTLGKTIIWCTHNLREAEEMCNRIAIIHRGSIIESGSIDYMHSLLEHEGIFNIKAGISSVDYFKELGINPLNISRNNGKVEFDVKEKSDNIPELLRTLAQNNIPIYECSRKKVELEEVFEKLIQHEL